jgi:hypothetical protein
MGKMAFITQRIPVQADCWQIGYPSDDSKVGIEWSEISAPEPENPISDTSTRTTFQPDHGLVGS